MSHEEFLELKKNLINAESQLQIIDKKLKNLKISKEFENQHIKKTLESSFNTLLQHTFLRLEITLQGFQELFQTGLPIPANFPYGSFFFLPFIFCFLVALLSFLIGRHLVLHQKKQWRRNESLFLSMSRSSFLSSFSGFSFLWKAPNNSKSNKIWHFILNLQHLFSHRHYKNNHRDFPKHIENPHHNHGHKHHTHHDVSQKDIEEVPLEIDGVKKDITDNTSLFEGGGEKNIQDFLCTNKNTNLHNNNNNNININNNNPHEENIVHISEEDPDHIKTYEVIFGHKFNLPLGPLILRWITSRLAILSALLLCPSLLYFLFSLILGRILIVAGIVDPSFLSLGYGALFPFYFYVFWALWQWFNVVVFENLLLISQDPSEVLFYGRLSLVGGLCGAISLTILDILSTHGPGGEKIFIALQDIFTLTSLWFLYKALSKIPKESVLCHGKKNALRSLFNGLSFGVFSLIILWILIPNKLFSSLIPLFLTALILLLWSPLNRWLTYYQLFFRRYFPQNRFFTQDAFLTQKKIPKGITQIMGCFSIGIVWASYFWWNNHQPLYNFFLSTATMIVTSPVFQKIFHTGIIIVIGFFLVKSGDRALKYYVEDKHTTDSQENNFFATRLKTLMSMLKTFLRISIWLPAITLILAQFEHLNLTTFVTGITAASVGLTFGIQNIVRDFITGFFIILENNLMVGDEVEIDSRIGKVEAITLRTLKIRGDNGTLLTIPFGSITVIGNRNRVFSAVLLNISVGYHEDIDRVQQLIERAFLLTKRIPVVGRKISGSLELRGINEVTSFSVVFQGKIMTAPNAQDMVRRAFNRQLKKLFDENNISVPIPPYSPQRSIPSLTQTQI